MSDAGPPPTRTGVLFVCYANVCRSPLAEGVFRHLVEGRSLDTRFAIDSAGTSAMDGASPHPYSVEVGARHRVRVHGEARQLRRADLSRFDHVLVMDRSNYAFLENMLAPSAFGAMQGLRARVRLLRAVSNPGARGHELDVVDPVGGDLDGFERCYQSLLPACEALLDELSP